jgi:hypothetical protein
MVFRRFTTFFNAALTSESLRRARGVHLDSCSKAPPMPASKSEIEALWRALFGGPPPVEAPAEMMLEVLVRHLPQPTPYGHEEASPVAPPAELFARPPSEN